MIPIVERKRLRPPVQFFQPLSHFIAARFTNMAMLTVWAADSQEEQQIANPTSLDHDPPHGIQVIRLSEFCVSTGGTFSSKRRRRIMPHDAAVDSIKLSQIWMHGGH
jgi:hypothetical protein